VNAILAQISDPHVSIGPADAGSAEALAAAVGSVAALDPLPDAVLLSGDLTEHATSEEYRRAAELLEPLPMPIHLLVGNHDDADGLRAHLGAPGRPGEPLQYSEDLGSLRLIACDTTVPGHAAGALGPERLGWLEAELELDRDKPTVLAMHHPPVLIGVGVLDQIGLAEADRLALGALLANNPQVKRIVSGHVHRGAVGGLGGCPVFVCPSSHLQLALDLGADSEIALVREPPAFALHVALGADLISHVVPIGDYGPPFRLY
jgi:3',5'-cyclic AMP phosphodiesterase CpdA